MQMPPADPDTLCAELLHDLPPETTAMARACKAFVRAKQVQPPNTSCAWAFSTAVSISRDEQPQQLSRSCRRR